MAERSREPLTFLEGGQPAVRMVLDGKVGRGIAAGADQYDARSAGKGRLSLVDLERARSGEFDGK